MEEDSAAEADVDREDEHDDDIDESEIEKYFDSDDEEIKQSLKTLLNMPLEFIEESSDEEEEPPPQKVKEQELEKEVAKEVEERIERNKDEEQRAEREKNNEEERKRKEHLKGGEKKKKDSLQRPREDSVERQLKKLFVEETSAKVKDTGFESISDNEFDGPESGECDTSDGELPDSPSIVVTLPDTPPLRKSGSPVMDDISDSESDVEVMGDYKHGNGEKTKPAREVIIEKRVETDILKSKDKKELVLSPSKEKSGEVPKNREKKRDKRKSIGESGSVDEDHEKIHKFKKYLAKKCVAYIMKMTKNETSKKKPKISSVPESSKTSPTTENGNVRLKSVIEKVKDKVTSASAMTSSRVDRTPHTSNKPEHTLHSDTVAKNRSSSSSEKDYRKSKPSKKSKSKSKELKEHKLRYKQYMQYLQSEREKCYEDSLLMEKNKVKSKRKRRKSKSSSPEKTKEKIQNLEKKEDGPKFLSFAEFCNSRELVTPERDSSIKSVKTSLRANTDEKKERTVSIDSVATTSTEPVDRVDEDKELFITYSDLVEQDKMKVSKLNEDRDQIETILEKDPELKSISVFTSVLFKGSADPGGIPFLQEGPPSSPKEEPEKPKKTFVLDKPSGPDEIYDWNDDDLSLISQSSLSPSQSPAPKVHNKALLNFVENQKERSAIEKNKIDSKRLSKSSRSRSKSPKKEKRSKKRKLKQQSSKSISVSPSPPPLKSRSPDVFKKRLSPPSYLKDRWKDYPSSPERRKEHYERPSRIRRRSRSRTRVRPGHSHAHRHRSRSSSEERARHPPPTLRRYHHSRSRSRSRTRSRSHSPPPAAMVQVSAAEKRRLLKERHERALASLRATIRGKPLSTAPVPNGDCYESAVITHDNYESVVMNEVRLVEYRVEERVAMTTEYQPVIPRRPPYPPRGYPPQYPMNPSYYPPPLSIPPHHYYLPYHQYH